MSAETTSWKTGASHACVSRRAIVLRTLVSCLTSISRGVPCIRGCPFGVAGAAVAARSTSSATIRPSGPVPRIEARSTPCSRAIRRASGDALIRLPSLDVTGPGDCPSGASAAARSGSRSAGAEAGSVAACAAPSSVTETSSPSSPMTAIVRPTSTSPPSTAIFSNTPEASASTSCVTLSVSSS